ncbi:uncharacterized protein LOC130031588 [Sorex fumeus]|uniref:uncharacterized protein LOC130031588 n=1 Tax=Sorex fumeus TaxID=62283 RepID=UPI0024AE30AC|nr:uncharacterized protein LOC130031588 [Sorex fumeus]
MGWRAAGPAPSSAPAPTNRNLLQCCGEAEGRGARGRAGCGPGRPRLAEGRREGARRAACSLPRRSLARSLAPSLGGWVSQSVRPPAAAGGPASRRGPEPRTPAPPPAIVHWAAAATGAGDAAREPRVRRGGGGVPASVGLEMFPAAGAVRSTLPGRRRAHPGAGCRGVQVRVRVRTVRGVVRALVGLGCPGAGLVLPEKVSSREEGH